MFFILLTTIYRVRQAKWENMEFVTLMTFLNKQISLESTSLKSICTLALWEHIYMIRYPWISPACSRWDPKGPCRTWFWTPIEGPLALWKRVLRPDLLLVVVFQVIVFIKHPTKNIQGLGLGLGGSPEDVYPKMGEFGDKPFEGPVRGAWGCPTMVIQVSNGRRIILSVTSGLTFK